MIEETGADVSPDTEAEDTAETEVNAEETVEAPENEAESPPAVEEDDEKKTDPFQERITELTRNWRETERALTALEQENAELKQKVADIPSSEPVKTLADFDYDEGKYQAHLFGQAEKRAEKAAERLLSAHQGNRAAETAETRFRDREKEFSNIVADYDEVVYGKPLSVSPAMADAIKESEIGPEIHYHLGKNPDTAAKLSRLSTVAAAREIGILEARLSAAKESASKKSVSKAPPPAETKLRGASASRKVSTTEPESDKLSDEEWFKLEEARRLKKG